MSIQFFHPLGENGLKVPPTGGHSDGGSGGYYWNTYGGYGHAEGSLDMGYKSPMGWPIYAMCDGEITYCRQSGIPGGGESENTYCCLKCNGSSNGLGEDFVIRYLHGIFTVSTGDIVKKGQQIGTVNTCGMSTGPHLHIDFSFGALNGSAAQSPPVYGTLSESNGKYYYTLAKTGKKYSLNLQQQSIDFIEHLKSQAGYDNSHIGYCWLVISMMPTELKAQAEGNSNALKVTIDDYVAKMFVGLTATECSWSNAAVAQGVLTVCRNWIYMDCNNTLGRTDLSFTSADIQARNALAEHFARFITGNVDWSLLDRYVNNYTAYFNKKVPGTNLTCLEFVKQFMSSGEHWTYIDKAIDNGSATLYSGRTKADVEDGVMFPSSSQPSQRLVLLPPFGDWILKWGAQGNEGSLTKPSHLLGLQ